MWHLLALLVLCNLSRLAFATCALSELSNQTVASKVLTLRPQDSNQPCLNFSSTGLTAILSNPLGAQVEELDLSHNKLQSLPPGFLANATGLKMLRLGDNKLAVLPPQWLEDAPQLKQLELERNPLASVPNNAFPHCLEKLSVDCGCEMAQSIASYCHSCLPSIDCHCFAPQGPAVNVSHFYEQNCRSFPRALYPAIFIPISAVVFATAGLTYFLLWRKGSRAVHQDKRGSNLSDGPHGQPRYISHTGPPSDVSGGSAYSTDYENVPAQPPQGRGKGKQRPCKPSKSRMPPHGDQPVYANTQDLYYNYAKAPPREAVDEDIYIIPDQ